MDSFELLKSLDEKHSKKADYTTLYSIENINKITDVQKANNAKAENPELTSAILTQDPSEKAPSQQITSSPLKLEEIVIGEEKDLEQDGDER